jgi:hypothetical protein
MIKGIVDNGFTLTRRGYAMNNIKQPLIKEIAELREELATLNIDLESAQLVRDAGEELYGTEAFFDFFMENADEMRVVSIHNEIEMYEKTLTLELALITTRYLITDAPLTSPAGFHPSSNVYIKNNVWIETNRLPRHLGGGLNAHDMHKNDEAA